MNSVAFLIAFRELRGGLAGFRIFLLCLALGVAGIAAVGSVRTAIQQALDSESNTLLGGDANLQFTYRFADETERQWMEGFADIVSEIVDFRSMVTVNGERALVQVKGIDGEYPVYGQVGLNVDTPLAELLADTGYPGLIAAPVLIDRLGLKVGDILRLGTTDFQLRASLIREPDGATAGFSFGPRVIVSLDALRDSGLLATGTLFYSHYRLKFPAGVNLAHMKTLATDEMADQGMRWQDARNGTPGLSRFVDRMGAFLVIVGLAGLAVGGIGVSAAVRAYLDGKKATIATLKTVGATSRTIFAIYLIQIGILATIGILLGLMLGAALPVIIGPLFVDKLPLPVEFSLFPIPLIEAALYGLLTAAIFTIWPLSQAIDTRPADLFRDEVDGKHPRPRWYFIVIVSLLSIALIAVATWFSGTPRLALWSAFGLLTSLLALHLAALGTKRLTRRFSRSKLTRGRPTLRMALGAVGGPGGEASSVILSLGLGLTVLATVGQIDSNMRRAVAEEIPAIAPAYFFLDIQNTQLADFLTAAHADEGVENIETAPMLRGIITRVNGEPAREVLGNHWVLRGDRGVTYSALPPKGATVTQGEWWPEDYSGEPQMSFAEEEALEMGLSLGDQLTVNILGRDLTATITSFRTVDFSDMGINFVMLLNPSALQAAPHTHIATVYADENSEGRLLRTLGSKFPNVTAISVRSAIGRVISTLEGIGAATRWGAAATLLTGFVVLIGAAAAGERRRVYEAALLKTLGATRARILASFAVRAGILGAAAGLVAIVAGGISGWAVMTFVMDVDFVFAATSAIGIVVGGALASLLAGLAFALKPLATRPAQVLRARE